MYKRIPRQLWTAIVIAGVPALGYVDWLTGYELNFFVFYFVPVSIAAWFLGFGTAVSVAVFSALVWSGADILSGHIYSFHGYAIWNTMVRLVSFLAMAWSVSKMQGALEREHDTVETLRRTLSQVKILETFLPICAECKKIRDQQGVWQQLEAYIGQHSNTQFTHSYCPECATKVLEEAGIYVEKSKLDR